MHSLKSAGAPARGPAAATIKRLLRERIRERSVVTKKRTQLTVGSNCASAGRLEGEVDGPVVEGVTSKDSAGVRRPLRQLLVRVRGVFGRGETVSFVAARCESSAVRARSASASSRTATRPSARFSSNSKTRSNMSTVALACSGSSTPQSLGSGTMPRPTPRGSRPQECRPPNAHPAARGSDQHGEARQSRRARL